MDPYVEFQRSWPNFHNRMIAEIANDLGARLPEAYVSCIDERIEIVAPDAQPPIAFVPDVLVGRVERAASRPLAGALTTPTATLEPDLVEILDRDPEEFRITWVEIRALPDLELVTAIEILSPINKGSGRRSYLEKREKLHLSKVNLVEIDLLLEGAPLPMKQGIAPGGYYAIVARAARLPVAEVYRWTVRDPLPILPIPLREPDADVSIDLSALATRVYDLGQYALTLRRVGPIPETTALSREDRAWVESVASRRAE
jgi:hypothetical protein